MKKVLIAALCTLAVIGSSTLFAFLISKAVNRGPAEPEKPANLLEISWYDEEGEEFTISTAEELREFADLSVYYDFAGQTVKLGEDIVLNEGTAEDFKKNAPENDWKPIVGFAGTFDGQGHAISGLYSNSYSNESAMFVRPDYHCTVKNFSLKNSYLRSSGYLGSASIMANGGGTFIGIYSDAVLEHRGENVGGIGSMVTGPSVFEECWFDGSITTTMRGVGGLVDCVGKTSVAFRHCLVSGSVVSSYIPLHYLDLGGRSGGLIGYVMNGGTLTTEDCLVSGLLESENVNHTGSYLGVLGGNGTATVSEIYVTDDTYRYILGAIGGSMQGLPVTISRSKLIGTNGYAWTGLDFDNYWAAVEDGTPVLKRFASEPLSTAGIEKAYDVGWYDENESNFVISNAKELYGFYYLSAKDSFENKTVSLGADIELNAGYAGEWGTEPPENSWQPIGIAIAPFKGTFDGQMHTISGLYIRSENKYNGLFGAVKDATIRNLKLKNSYITSTDQWTGSFVGRGNGTFENLYSNAIIVSGEAFEGGLLGQADYGPVTMKNCWFDGSVTNTYSAGENSRGFVGGFIGYAAGVETTLQDCLYTGHVDVSTMKVKNLAGAAGFIGIVEGTPTLNNVLMIGTVKAGEMIGYYAHVAQGTPSGGVAYAVLDAPNEDCTDWQGNYGGWPTDQFIYHAVERKATVGSLVKFTMPEFDWENTWLAVSGGHPVLQAFADEAIPSAEWIDISWYDSEPYVLRDIGDLYGFAELVNSGITFEGKTVTLGADITVNTGNAAGFAANEPQYSWIPAGRESTPFKGTFDGGMHTISGLYVNTNTKYSGLFGYIKGAAVSNLKLKNSYLGTTEQWIGSFAGRGYGTFRNLYSNAIIVSSAAFEGGIIGQTDFGPASITNCWFGGTIVNTYSAGENQRGLIGGFVGHDGGVALTLKDCLFTGHIDISALKVQMLAATGGFVGACETSTVLQNAVMLGSVKGSSMIGYYAHVGHGTPSGSNAYAVLTSPDGNTTDWPGNYGGHPTDAFTYKAVSREGANGSIAKVTMDGLDWANTWTTVSGNHPVLRLFAGEVASYPETIDVAWYDSEPYVLEDANDLLGFAKLVNSGIDFEGKTVFLGADVTLNTGNAADWATAAPENVWTPIGRKDIPFKGTFDGQGHTISGLYASCDDRAGLFGLTVDATIRDVKLTNSYLASTGQWIGSFVGQGSGTFFNLYSDAILTTPEAMIGGIVGANDDANARDLRLERCWFDGTVSCTHAQGVNSGAFAGGLIGHVGIGRAVINNCLVTGRIDIAAFKYSAGGNPKTGGLVGVLNASDGTLIMNTAFLGTFEPGANANQIGLYAIAGDTSQRNTDGALIYSMVDYNVIAGAYSMVDTGRTLSYTNLGATAFPLGEDAKTRMEKLDWENVFVTRESDLPALRLTAGEEIPPIPELPEEEPEDPGEESWYNEDETTFVLTTAKELCEFSELVSSGVSFEGKTVKLDADITFNEGNAADWALTAPENVWTPIGKSGFPFKGTFDGQGHTISGLYTSGDNRVGLFGLTTGAVIRDVKLTNSYFVSTGQWIGSFVGQGSGTLTNLYSDAVLKTSGAMIGGIVGANDDGSYLDLIMESCWFDGTLTNDHSAGANSGAFAGGLVGYFGVGTNRINNGLVTGHIDISAFVPASGGNPKTGGLVGVNATTGSVTITNTAFLGTFNAGANANKAGLYAICGDTNQRNMNGSAVYAMVDYNQIAGGYAAVASGYSISYTNLGVSDFPIGAAASARMPALDWEKKWMVREEDLPALRLISEEGGNTEPDPGEEPGETITPDKSWYEAEPYVIEDAADLLGFAELVNSGTSFEGKTVTLGADITLNTGNASEWASTAPQNAWTPIGKSGFPFMGTFDGDGHTISGLYTSGINRVGLFGLTISATIRDVKLTNSYFASTGQWIGSFVGQGSGTLTTLYSDAILKTSGAMIGGIVGANDDANNKDLQLEQCWFDGTLTNDHSAGGNSGAFAGGLVGYFGVGTNTIHNCLVTGQIDISAFVPASGGNPKTGGLVGVNATTGSTTITNTAFLGTFNAGANANKVGIYAIGGDAGQRNMNGSAIYAMVDYYQIGGGYYNVASGYSISYTNLGVSNFPIGADAANRMPALDWENVFVTRDGKLPALKAFAE